MKFSLLAFCVKYRRICEALKRWKELYESMDLTVMDVNNLFDRANLVWEEEKSNVSKGVR